MHRTCWPAAARVVLLCTLTLLGACRSLTLNEYAALNAVYHAEPVRNGVNLYRVRIHGPETKREVVLAAARAQIENEIASGQFNLSVTRMSSDRFLATADQTLRRLLANEKAMTIGYNIFYNYARPDYALNRPDWALLSHEVMHVWQWQHRDITRYSLAKVLWEHIKCGPKKVYLYRSPPQRPFLTHRFEQQGAIVQDRVLFDNSDLARSLRGALNATKSEVQNTACY
jgi:hypothetical protein